VGKHPRTPTIVVVALDASVETLNSGELIKQYIIISVDRSGEHDMDVCVQQGGQ
jgi:hypothetical protein